MFKDKLIEIRKENNDTQELLGKKINVSRSLIAKWEQGRAYPGYEQIEAISEVYNKPIEFLLSKYELKEVYGYYRKNNKIKNGIIIGVTSLLILSVAAVITIGIGLNNLDNKGNQEYNFRSISEDETSYHFEFNEKAFKNSISKNEPVTKSFFGTEWDKYLDVNEMNNGGVLSRDYYHDFNGTEHNSYDLRFNTPEFEDKDFATTFYVNFRDDYSSKNEIPYDKNDCLYFEFKNDVVYSDGSVRHGWDTNATYYKVTYGGYHSSNRFAIAEFEFTFDEEKLNKYLNNEYQNTTFVANPHYIYGDGSTDICGHSKIFNSHRMDVNIGRQASDIPILISAKEHGTDHRINMLDYRTESHFDYHSVIFLDEKSKPLFCEIMYTFNAKKSVDYYEIIEYDSDDNLLAKTTIRDFDEFNTYQPNSGIHHVYVNGYRDGKLTSYVRSENKISVSFSNDVGIFSSQAKEFNITEE